jgi:Zn-finger nucleic acid-binding protein
VTVTERRTTRGIAMNCPKCRAAIEKVDYQGIEVDRCTACEGIWFDSLEEEKMAALAGSEQVDTGIRRPAARSTGWTASTARCVARR